MKEIKKVEINAKVLAANQLVANKLREDFALQGTLVVNLISSPGSGKTSLLECCIPLLEEFRVGVLEGDIATERDTDRIRRLGVPAHQILTGGACHLDARLVGAELEKAGMKGLDLLFIENVGNLICPSSYDLGEDFKVALLSVTEGDDKPFKYPGIFSRASVSVISKSDLLPHVDFDLDTVQNQILTLNPLAQIFVTSAREGQGVEEWCRFLERKLATKRQPAAT